MADFCNDGRFELIEKYKLMLMESTNISDSEDELKVLDTILFRFWQMGWLYKLEQPTAQQWIPCDERLPEDRRYVLVTFRFVYGLIDNGITWYGESENKWDTSREVIAWMPLPEPYKERREE